jgi:hypothetical protein
LPGGLGLLLHALLPPQLRRRLALAQAAPGLGHEGGARVLAFLQGGGRLGQAGALGGQVALQLDALARAVLVDMGGH